jgi:hypothetical protein
MASKEILTQNIKGWLQIEKEIQLLQKELKERKLKKKTLTNSLVGVMKTNDIDCFDITDGKIMYTQTRSKSSVNKAHLFTCLQKYFAAHPNMPIDDIVQYILDSRELITKDSIRLKQGIKDNTTDDD